MPLDSSGQTWSKCRPGLDKCFGTPIFMAQQLSTRSMTDEGPFPMDSGWTAPSPPIPPAVPALPLTDLQYSEEPNG